MGYCSDAIIAVSKKVLAQDLIAPCIPEALREMKYVDYQEDRYWVIRQWKWYSSYSEIQDIEAFFNSLDKKEFGAIRVGEEPGDIQQWGSPEDFDISTYTSIYSPIGST